MLSGEKRIQEIFLQVVEVLCRVIHGVKTLELRVQTFLHPVGLVATPAVHVSKEHGDEEQVVAQTQETVRVIRVGAFRVVEAH